jgi:hypothetical protein
MPVKKAIISKKNQLAAAKTLIAEKVSSVPPSTAPITVSPQVTPPKKLVNNLTGNEQVAGLVSNVGLNTASTTPNLDAADWKFSSPLFGKVKDTPSGNLYEKLKYLSDKGAQVDIEAPNMSIPIGKGRQLGEWQNQIMGQLLLEGRKRNFTPQQFQVAKNDLLNELEKKGDRTAKLLNTNSDPNKGSQEWIRRKKTMMDAISNIYREQYNKYGSRPTEAELVSVASTTNPAPSSSPLTINK